mmetsp:Transcript_17758/g.40991  ORF Transcript_17758/g.40991 Transcript_17758/m.40991 type:complete len:377 (-) Transcript_17758:158-1288(-)
MTTKYNPSFERPKIFCVNTLLLLITIVPFATAFSSEAGTASVASVSLFGAHFSRPSLSCRNTGIYRGRVRSASSTASLLSKTQNHGSIRTRLHFSDNISSNTTIESGWWRRLFQASHLPNRSPKTTSSSCDKQSNTESEEQESVDTYLEFLDKRYRRLHCDDVKEDKTLLQQRLGSKSKPFSAMDWLTSGGNDNTNAVTTSPEQQADALYVLGVAGLASQKLLQKHHLPNPNKFSGPSSKIASDGLFTDAMELNLEKSVESDECYDPRAIKKWSIVCVKIFLLPIVRIIYFAQRQKQLFLKIAHQNMAGIAAKVTGPLVAKRLQDPRSIANALLTIIGGKRSILRTITIGYVTAIFFRPVFEVIISGGLPLDPLIQ